MDGTGHVVASGYDSRPKSPRRSLATGSRTFNAKKLNIKTMNTISTDAIDPLFLSQS